MNADIRRNCLCGTRLLARQFIAYLSVPPATPAPPGRGQEKVLLGHHGSHILQTLLLMPLQLKTDFPLRCGRCWILGLLDLERKGTIELWTMTVGMIGMNSN